MPNDNLHLSEKQIKEITEELYKRNADLFFERKRTEELLYKVSEAIYATDKEHKITLFNHTLERILGVKKEDILGKDIKSVLTLINDKKEEIDLYNIKEFADNLKSQIPIALLQTPTKEHYLHIKVSEIQTDTTQGEILVTMSDVTAEKELEKEKEEFISITSHELKTPLSIIKSYLWMLQEKKGGDITDKQKNYIEKAMIGTERLITLVNDMLNISRAEQNRMDFKKDTFDLNALTKEVVSEVELKANEKNLILKLENPSDVFVVKADHQKTREILLNIIGNAVKYTEKGSINVSIVKDGDYIKVLCTDTGRGVSPDEMSKLFQKFHRLDNSFTNLATVSGTGLGLYIVKLYVEKMNGMVGVESKGLGLGSTFWFTLPKDS